MNGEADNEVGSSVFCVNSPIGTHQRGLALNHFAPVKVQK